MLYLRLLIPNRPPVRSIDGPDLERPADQRYVVTNFLYSKFSGRSFLYLSTAVKPSDRLANRTGFILSE